MAVGLTPAAAVDREINARLLSEDDAMFDDSQNTLESSTADPLADAPAVRNVEATVVDTDQPTPPTSTAQDLPASDQDQGKVAAAGNLTGDSPTETDDVSASSAGDAGGGDDKASGHKEVGQDDAALSAQPMATSDVEDADVETVEDAADETALDSDSAESEVAESGVAESEVIDEPAGDVEMDWYILKVQSNRERSIAEALQRKIAVEGLDRYFGQVIVPTEKVTEFKGGKKKIVERKLWPGYIVVHMHINDDTWFAVRETSGIGDFTGAAGKPTPMQAHEVARIIQTEDDETEEAPKLAIKFKQGDKVKVKEGNFESFEGEVGTIDEASGRVTVMINIFGRSTPVELEYWQIESV